MLDNNEAERLTKVFEEIYRKKTPMELLDILTTINEYLHKETAVVRRLAFCDDNWKFRAVLKLRREMVQAEIYRR